MTESSATDSENASGPWLIKASDPRLLDVSNLPGDRERRTFVGYVYVVRLGEDLVKVGKTTRPRARIADYVGKAQLTGRRVTRAWVSSPHLNYNENEKALINFGDRKSVV